MKKQFTLVLSHYKLMVVMIIAMLLMALFVVVQRSEGGYSANPTLHVFSADTAPEAGTVVMYTQFGFMNRPEGNMVGTWALNKGQHLDAHVTIRAGQRTRVWFKATDSSEWQLLPSQYWQTDSISGRGVGTCESEFGVSADSDLPSYHTHFANAVKQSDVPMLKDTLGSQTQCGVGSAEWRDGVSSTATPPSTSTSTPSTATPPSASTSTPSPTRTPALTRTPAPTATPCISLERGQSGMMCR